ncbi:MAG: VanW family protein [Patescibacteria group bacterium]|nr:VanW family protein [Patescibacteria group bacterium]
MMPTLISYITFAMVTSQMLAIAVPTPQVLGQEQMSLADRYPVASVNDVFKDNILLSLAYLRGAQKHGEPVDWQAVEKPFSYSFVLQPNEVFAFHKDVLPQFEGKVVKTMDSSFGGTDGYKSDGYLYGDGVCHMASILNWAARDAGLAVVAPTPHDFAVIPDIPRQYGTAIYFDPNSSGSNAEQNLYIQNTKDKPVTFTLSYENNSLQVNITENN